MHTLTIPRNSLFLRFFLWVWEVNPDKLNICKLFWGTFLFPLAFIQVKKECRFIPRIAFLYMVGAVICAALGSWGLTIVCFVGGVLIVVAGYINMRIGQSTAEKREEKEHALSDISGRGSAVAFWILDHTLGLVFDLFYNVVDLRAGQRVGGFFAVIGEYARATKQRLCPLIRVI